MDSANSVQGCMVLCAKQKDGNKGIWKKKVFIWGGKEAKNEKGT